MPIERRPVAELLVEGKNDQHIVWALCKHYEIPQVFSVEQRDGIDELLASISIRAKTAGLYALGIMVDADGNLHSRWQAIKECLGKIGYQQLPDGPQEKGMVLQQENKPRIGLWIMPDNKLPGMIEDFSRFLIDEADPLLTEAESILQQIESRRIHRYKISHRAKALIHTWLAWQDPPGMPMGQAITVKALNPDSPIAQEFVSWLQCLFVDNI